VGDRWARAILHADMDAFYASIEQRDDPSLRDRPVLVGGSSERGVVAAASYEARVFGIHSAMPSAQARKLCPDAVFLRGDMKKYQRESRRIFEVFRRFTPSVEGISLDEAFLDLTGTGRLLGPPEQVGQRLRAEVREATGLAVSVGIAPVKMVAKIASDQAKPDGLLVVEQGRVRAFLAPLPVGRIWGVGPVARKRLEALGIRTIGDLAARSDEELSRALGSFGISIGRLARGEDSRDVESHREARSYGEENTFGQDVRDRGRLESAIRAHAEAVARRLRRDGVRAGGVTLQVKLARPLGGGRYPLLTRSTILPEPTSDGRAIARAACAQLDRIHEPDAIRLIGVSATRIEPEQQSQLDLLPGDPEAVRRGRLNETLDAVRDRFGSDALVRGRPQAERAGLSHQIKRGDD
jgi:DNA polymerase-4